MELHNRYDEHAENKFVITEDEAYFVPYLERVEAPPFKEILREICDLDDPEVYREVDDQLNEGRMVLGHFDPSTKEVELHVPLETSDYVGKRIKEVFGDV